MGLLARRHYPIHTRVLLTLECEDQGSSLITSRAGWVVWTGPPAEDGRRHIGIAFSEGDAQGGERGQSRSMTISSPRPPPSP